MPVAELTNNFIKHSLSCPDGKATSSYALRCSQCTLLHSM